MKNANEHINILYLKFEPSERYEDHSSIRALHRYRRGHGFESRSDLNFFQALSSQRCVCNCDDQSFLHVVTLCPHFLFTDSSFVIS